VATLEQQLARCRQQAVEQGHSVTSSRQQLERVGLPRGQFRCMVRARLRSGAAIGSDTVGVVEVRHQQHTVDPPPPPAPSTDY
jgi:hypothetical protein